MFGTSPEGAAEYSGGQRPSKEVNSQCLRETRNMKNNIVEIRIINLLSGAFLNHIDT
jgi:hypothetical protein